MLHQLNQKERASQSGKLPFVEDFSGADVHATESVHKHDAAESLTAFKVRLRVMVRAGSEMRMLFSATSTMAASMCRDGSARNQNTKVLQVRGSYE